MQTISYLKYAPYFYRVRQKYLRTKNTQRASYLEKRGRGTGSRTENFVALTKTKNTQQPIYFLNRSVDTAEKFFILVSPHPPYAFPTSTFYTFWVCRSDNFFFFLNAVCAVFIYVLSVCNALTDLFFFFFRLINVYIALFRCLSLSLFQSIFFKCYRKCKNKPT